MEQGYYLIKEVAKEVHVETHVLRYWEEELGLSIMRNSKGHRMYSREDVAKLIRVKRLKDEGLQLKAVKKLLGKELIEEKKNIRNQENEPKVINFHIKDDSEVLDTIENESLEEDNADTVSKIVASTLSKKEEVPTMAIEIKERKENNIGNKQKSNEIIEQTQKEIMTADVVTKLDVGDEQNEKAKKALRLQVLFQNMIQDAVTSNQEQIMDAMKANIAKEFDFQFRQLEELQDERELKQMEREEERERERREREEQHYHDLDLLLRKVSTKVKRKKLSKD